MIRMRDERERGTLLMQRDLPVHWRFQQLLGFPEDTTNDGLYQWCLAVQTAIREVLGGGHPRSEDMMRRRGRLYRAEAIVGFRRQKKMTMEVLACRAEAHGTLWLAAGEEVADREAIRIADLHPWVAEPAEHRFQSDRHAAVLMAAANVEAEWRQLVESPWGSLGSLAERFNPKAKLQDGDLILRLSGHTPGTADWDNPHKGAYCLAKSCASVRNVLAHRADVPISPGYALEQLSGHGHAGGQDRSRHTQDPRMTGPAAATSAP